MLKDIPEPVRRYLRHTGIVGKPFVDTVYLEQKGQMYLGAGQGWVPLDAQEHYTVQFDSYPVREPWLLEPARRVQAGRPA